MALYEGIAASAPIRADPSFLLKVIGKGEADIPAAVRGKVVKLPSQLYQARLHRLHQSSLVNFKVSLDWGSMSGCRA